MRLILVFSLILLFFSQAWASESETNFEVNIAELKLQAENGDLNALIEVGKWYLDKKPVDEAAVLYWYTMAADGGHAEAQYVMGTFYKGGWRCLEVDFTQALKYYLLAAEQGNTGAQARLGGMYHLGIGVELNFEEAFKWLSKAAENGFNYDNRLAEFLLNDYDEHGIKDEYNIPLLIEKAESGNLQAQKALVLNGYFDDDKFNITLDLFAEWNMTARKQGQTDKDLTAMIASSYLSEGLDEEGMRWYQYAVEDGVDMGVFCLELGNDFLWEEDSEKAFTWYKRAAEHGNNEAKLKLKKLQESIDDDGAAFDAILKGFKWCNCRESNHEQ